MKKIVKNIIGAVLALSMTVSFAGCEEFSARLVAAQVRRAIRRSATRVAPQARVIVPRAATQAVPRAAIRVRQVAIPRARATVPRVVQAILKFQTTASSPATY